MRTSTFASLLLDPAIFDKSSQKRKQKSKHNDNDKNKHPVYDTMSGKLKLLSKITIGGQELKNRIALAPMTRAR